MLKQKIQTVSIIKKTEEIDNQMKKEKDEKDNNMSHQILIQNLSISVKKNQNTVIENSKVNLENMKI